MPGIAQSFPCVRHQRIDAIAGTERSDLTDPDDFGPASLSEPGPDAEAPAGAESPESSTDDSVLLLAQQHPELDWSDPEGALETLAILNDPEAMADLEEADDTSLRSGRRHPVAAMWAM